MAGRIPESFIQQLLSRVDIVDVIHPRVALKKAGREYKACCPFHNENTPSFTVSQQKQFYHCFGCGAHGTAVGFLMEYEGLEFPDAIEELAGQLGMEVPRETGRMPARDDDFDALLGICREAAAYYRQQLREAPRAVDYLRGRGLDGSTAQRFGLGYAPPGFDRLSNALGRDGTRQRLMLKAGLLADRDGRHYDRFRDRIIFPIHDRRGRVIAFGGRLLEGDGPKYLNSPETPLFHKGRELYGFHLARAALSGHRGEGRPPPMLVVEGYMDVVALSQHGIHTAVATLGTATTDEHVEMLFRASAELVFCFDGDRAGRDAAWRAAQTALKRLRDGRQARFLFLPDGEDPDSLVRRLGAEGFRQQLEQARPLSQLVFDVLGEGLGETVDDRARLAEKARPLIETIPEGAFQDLMQQELSRRTGVTVATAERKPAVEPGAVSPFAGDGLKIQRTPVRHSIALLLQSPALASRVEVPDALTEAPVAGVDILHRLLETLRASPHLNNAGAVLEQFRSDAMHPHLQRLATVDLPGDSRRHQQELNDNLASLARLGLQARFDQLRATARERALSEDERQSMLALQRALFGRH